jgi:hypothetical protein
MPSVTAKRQCPDLIFVKPRFEVYKAVLQQIREIFAEHTPVIKPLSLDEAYLDVTENLQAIPLARDVALAIRAKIKEVTGLNASAGISYNKFLAKLASDHRKPNGQYVITPEMGPTTRNGFAGVDVRRPRPHLRPGCQVGAQHRQAARRRDERDRGPEPRRPGAAARRGRLHVGG